MKKAGMARSKAAGLRRGCWIGGLGNDDEGVRDRARQDIVNALPELIEALLDQARSGSVAHMKLLIQLERDLDKPESGEQRGKGLEQILMEQWAKDAANEGVL